MWKSPAVAIRLLVAAFFFYVGLRKFTPAAGGLLLLAQIRAPEWFRSFNGVLQMTGSAMLIFDRMVLIGVWFLGCTMLAAMVTWVAVFNEPSRALPAGLMLAVLAGIAAHHVRDEVRAPDSRL